MIGVSLSDLVRGVRAESGKSLNTALGVAERDALVYQIQCKQEWLYYEYDWPFLIDQEPVALVANTRFVPFPTTISYDFVNEVWCSTDNVTSFTPVTYGIGPVQYNQSGVGNTSWPVCRWTITTANQIEVWPVPDQAGFLRVVGRRALGPLVDNADLSTLDGTLIVLFVAADVLARQKAEDAKLKLAAAQRHLRNLQRRQNANKQNPIVLGGGAPNLNAGMSVNRNLLWAPGA
jgi:hypothetical protein